MVCGNTTGSMPILGDQGTAVLLLTAAIGGSTAAAAVIFVLVLVLALALLRGFRTSGWAQTRVGQVAAIAQQLGAQQGEQHIMHVYRGLAGFN